MPHRNDVDPSSLDHKLECVPHQSERKVPSTMSRSHGQSSDLEGGGLRVLAHRKHRPVKRFAREVRCQSKRLAPRGIQADVASKVVPLNTGDEMPPRVFDFPHAVWVVLVKFILRTHRVERRKFGPKLREFSSSWGSG